MSNKRVLSPSPSPTPDADTLVDLQHRNKMLKPNIIQKKLSDPVRTLNVDIMNLIFDRLPIVDLGSCVSLSKAWKSAVLGWMHQSPKRVGRKLRPMNFETVPATLWQGMSIAEIRRHGRYFVPTGASRDLAINNLLQRLVSLECSLGRQLLYFHAMARSDMWMSEISLHTCLRGIPDI